MRKLDTSGFNCPIPIIKAKRIEYDEVAKFRSSHRPGQLDIESLQFTKSRIN